MVPHVARAEGWIHGYIAQFHLQRERKEWTGTQKKRVLGQVMRRHGGGQRRGAIPATNGTLNT